VNPPIVFPNYPLVQPGAPAGTPGNAPVQTQTMTASGIPLGAPAGCLGCGSDGEQQLVGPMLRDVAPAPYPLWAKLLGGGVVLGCLIALGIYAAKRR
jgi:hypothetical protein